MRTDFITMRYYETYYYANVIHNVLASPGAYLRNLNDWYEDKEIDLFLRPFMKWSVLHDLSYFIIKSLMYEKVEADSAKAYLGNVNFQLWVDEALSYHRLKSGGFQLWLAANNLSRTEISDEDIHGYIESLQEGGELDSLLEQMTNEVFFVLFGNRSLLSVLNNYIAEIIIGADGDYSHVDCYKFINKKGRVKRVYIPMWVKNAVFFRDRGRCVFCNTDLSGVLKSQNDIHYDHIVALDDGGINDVTNMQLLCGSCNLKKGTSPVGTSASYETWY